MLKQLETNIKYIIYLNSIFFQIYTRNNTSTSTSIIFNKMLNYISGFQPEAHES
jgi:hypothetical protein